MRMTYVKVFIVQLLFIHLSEGQKEGDLLLSDGSNSRRGRLEIYHNGSWGTICDDYFDALDAVVVCRQLIHRDVRGVSYYTAGGGTGTIWMDNLNCSGKELNISSCSHNGWGIENCGHGEDVGIQCNLQNEGDLYLSAGNNSREGRLEIYPNGRWGTICDDNFGTLDALVACKQLANRNVREVFYYTAGGGTGTIWMDDLSCSGKELNLSNCSHNGWGIENCGHSEDVGIKCNLANEGDLHLSGGGNPREGRLEIYHNGRWGTICDDKFGTLDALVACRQLTKSFNGLMRNVSYYTAGGGTGTIWMDDLACSGSELNLYSCSHGGWGDHDCSHDTDVGIRCYENEGDLRVSGEDNPREGRLEIYHNGRWGTICEDNFGSLDALIACRQLTHSFNGHMRNVSYYTAGGGTGTIWMDDLACSGREWNLFSCSHGGWGDHDCSHDEDVGIRCYENEGDLRVSGGYTSRDDRLEIYHNGMWGTICNDNFGTADTIVACRQLTNRNVRNATYYTAGGGTGTTWLDELACSGTEWTISNCSHAGWGVENCRHDKDVGIRCYETNDELEITDTTTTNKYASYLDLNLEIDNKRNLVSKIYDKQEED